MPALGKKWFTPVQRRMLLVLADGLPHPRAELHACLHDEMGPVSNIKAHLSLIRRVLRDFGQDIVCERYRRKVCYRHIAYVPRGRGGTPYVLYREFVGLVRARDGDACRECGKRPSHTVHHVKPWRDFPEGRFDPANAVVLCDDCHAAKGRGRPRKPCANPTLNPSSV